tara:strand:- start:5853 stop:7673 length:1821 start_codon:yes stop_codon:yes gene_type:complete
MKKPFLYFLFVFIILSCGGSDDGPTTKEGPKGSDHGEGAIETFTVKPLKSEYTSFEVADLEVDIDLSNESYNGTFNDSEITLLKNEEGNLSFLVPELPVGSYNIKVFVDEAEGSSSVSVLELKEIENVDAYLEENLLSVVDEGITVGNSSTDLDNQELINEGLSYLNEFNKEFLNLTDEQKRALAYVIKNNQIVLSGLFNEPNGVTGKGFDWDSQIQPLVNILLVSKSALVALIGGIVVATYGGLPLLGGALIGLAFIKYIKVINTRASILDAITIPILNDLNQLNNKSQQGKPTDLTLTNNGTKNFSVISKGRGLIKSDLNHPNQKVVNTVSSINESDNAITDLQQKVQKLIDIVGSFFTGRENKIEKLGELPESAAEEIITVALEHFFIEDQPSDIDVGIVALDANTLQIKFTSAGNEPTQFTAKFIYDDGDFRTETALNVNLLEKDETDEDIENMLMARSSWRISTQGPSNETTMTRFWCDTGESLNPGEAVTYTCSPSLSGLEFKPGGSVDFHGTYGIVANVGTWSVSGQTVSISLTFESNYLQTDSIESISYFNYTLSLGDNQGTFSGTGTYSGEMLCSDPPVAYSVYGNFSPCTEEVMMQ